ncbi:hypothetical protein [Paraburkholderia tropica]|uniref:hypothetical protein n=1 Tax=Paraburkholderia tropica TaxID=92647 RepID=UPI002AB68734|nr:hypothetical protein [Paraburkholderia tropica]
MKYLVAIGLFVIGCVMGWAGTLYYLHPPSDSSSSASWVQAVGSIAAIASAFAVVYAQKHLDKQSDANDLSIRRGKAKELSELLVSNAVKDSRDLETVYELNWMSERTLQNVVEVLADTRQRFNIVPWNDLGKDQAVIVESARDCLTKLISISRKREPQKLPEDAQRIAISEVRVVTGELDKLLTKLQASRHE